MVIALSILSAPPYSPGVSAVTVPFGAVLSRAPWNVRQGDVRLQSFWSPPVLLTKVLEGSD